MRISDWSSDVCSSDLPGRHPSQARGWRWRVGVRAVSFVPRKWLGYHARLPFAGRRSEVNRSRQEIAQKAGFTRQPGARQLRPSGAAATSSLMELDLDESSLAIGRIERSEEHTSELQSLMRI